MYIFFISIITFVCDQLSKYIVVHWFHLGASHPIIPNVLHLTYVTNTGTAFSLLKGYNTGFIVFTIVCLILLIVYRKKLFAQIQKTDSFYYVFVVGIGLLIGGACGNLFDRIVRGNVVDFIDLRVWPVFNIADTSICVSAFLLGLYIWKRG